MAPVAESIAVMQCINSICPCFCNPIKEAGDECISSCLCLERNWVSLNEERGTLKAKGADLEREIAIEEQRLNQPTEEATLWLKRFATLTKNETQKAEYDTLKRCLCNCTPNIWRRLWLGQKVSRELQEVRTLTGQLKDITPSCVQRLPSTMDRARRHKMPFGMEQLLSQLRDYFNDKRRSVIGIHGLAGVGKTTLLSEFYHELKGRDDYHVVIFIEVSNSEVLNVAGMQETIARRLSLPWNKEETEAFRAESFLQVLIKRRKFVILLDDVRKAFELEKVGIPDPSVVADYQCKLIIASQSEDVCVKMEAQKSMIEVKCLDQEVAWVVFRRNLSEEAITAIEGDSAIRKNAEDIVQTCGGLPLAINVIGRAVASQTDQREWRIAAGKLMEEPLFLTGMDTLFSRLKYSYDQLMSDVHQSCFLYCALFPEYGSIKKNKLTGYWVCEDLVRVPNAGNNIIRELVSASLLEKSGDSEVKMHGIIRKLAIWLASADCKNVSSEFLVQAGLGLKEAPKPRMWKGATRISLMLNDIEKLAISPECTSLSTLLLQNNPNLKELHPDFFKNMTGLKVLDLSHTAIEELPIGADTLPELQHLNLCHTRIAKLPKELSNLKKLSHLDLSETSALQVIPDGTISVLINLRVLNLYRSLFEIRGKGDLNLEHLVNLEFLGITIHSKEVLEKLQADDRLASSTRSLSLQNCQGMKTVKVSVLHRMASLEVLFVHDCSELKHLILDGMQNGFNLQELTLASLPKFEGIIPNGPQSRHHLDNLCDLTIESCHKLENVTWILQLKSLERLAISQCDAMEQVVQEGIVGDASQQANEIIDEEHEAEIQVVIERQNGAINGDAITSFGRLKSILLKDLKNLESICHPRPFPCLETISVENCLKLNTLPLGCSYQKRKLKQMRGSLDWWSKLVWEDVNLSTNFDALFVPI